MVGISAVGVVLVPKKVGLEKHLARRELPEDVSFGMILAPSWLSRNRVWKTAPGVCDHAIYAVPSYTVGLHPFRSLHPSEVLLIALAAVITNMLYAFYHIFFLVFSISPQRLE